MNAMNGSSALINVLLQLKVLSADVHDRLHDQEHCWEAAEYHKLEHKWDKANREVWDDLHHRFLRRIYDLGGSPDGVTTDVTVAYRNAISNFQKLRALCQQAYAVAETANDQVTMHMLMKVEAKAEKWLTYFEAKQGQVSEIDLSDFMSEQM